MNSEILSKAKIWTSSEYSEETRKEIQNLIDTNNEKELTDRFWRDLEFGTGGLRGVRGAGSNRMNIYNIKKVTQGLANYLKQQNALNGVVIGRDSRIFSLEFAQASAAVLVANNIPVFFFKELCATPVVSFAIRQLNAHAGIMNTASHNPKEYNGYKVFWADGGQLVPPHDNNVIDHVQTIESLKQVQDITFDEAEQSPLFRYCDDILENYLDEAQKISRNPELCQTTDLKILYSPLHGCGYNSVPKMMKRFGFRDFTMIAEQAFPDGEFPTTPYPNPEDEAAMSLGIDTAKKEHADIFIATDPDADRIGVVFKTSKDQYELLNGNQIGVLMTDYLLRTSNLENKFIITTIVSTPLIKKMAEDNGVESGECLTGFRWIVAKTQEMTKQNKQFLFGFEESHGYNALECVYDKDGVSSAALFAEITAYHKQQGKCLDEVLFDLALKYGYYKESQYSLSLTGSEGSAKILEIMQTLRTDPPREISGLKVLHTVDYMQSEKTGLPKSNVIALFLEEDARIIARPSGTEPKIKFYFANTGNIGCSACIPPIDQLHEKLKTAFVSLFQ